MLKILQARLQQYVNREFPVVQAGFRKGRGTRFQIANIRWFMEKAREFQKNIYVCSVDYAKAFDYVDHNKLENSERDGKTRPPDLLPGASVRNSSHGKGHEEGGSAYAKAGSSLRSPPGSSRASNPKTRVCLFYCFVLSPTPLTLWGALPHHLSLKKS